jgi:hypothetical protein
VTRAALWVIALSALVGRPEAATARAPRLDHDLRMKLRTSAVPVLLPRSLPRALGRIRSIAVIDAGRGGYYVGYSPVAHCAGSLACAFFHVAGAPAPARRERLEPPRRAVRLADGIRAVFAPKDCSGASCTESSLFFERGGACYELDVKVPRGDLAVLETVYRSLRVVR